MRESEEDSVALLGMMLARAWKSIRAPGKKAEVQESTLAFKDELKYKAENQGRMCQTNKSGTGEELRLFGHCDVIVHFEVYLILESKQ